MSQACDFSTGEGSPPNHVSKSSMHETNGCDGLLDDLHCTAEDAEDADDDPIHIPPEPLPDPAPPENFGNPQQMPVYATHHFKLASSLVYISCDPYHLASTSSALKLPVKIMAHEKIYIQVHHYATDSVSVAKSRSIHFMVATIDEVCAILSQSGFVSLSTSSSVQIECYKYSAISLVIDSCASFLPFLSAFPALSPLLATGLLLHLIPIQVPYFLLLAISLPLALVAKLHLSIILKMVLGSYLSLQNLLFKQFTNFLLIEELLCRISFKQSSMFGSSWWGDFTPSSAFVAFDASTS